MSSIERADSSPPPREVEQRPRRETRESEAPREESDGDRAAERSAERAAADGRRTYATA